MAPESLTSAAGSLSRCTVDPYQVDALPLRPRVSLGFRVCSAGVCGTLQISLAPEGTRTEPESSWPPTPQLDLSPSSSQPVPLCPRCSGLETATDLVPLCQGDRLC